MVLRSADCSALQVHDIHSVPKSERPRLVRALHVANFTWTRGHFPYPKCKARNGNNINMAKPMTILMVADFQYTPLIPSWADQVQSLGYDCAVGDVGRASEVNQSDASLSPCAAAAASNCECFLPPTRAPRGLHRWDKNNVMALAVRWRFFFAKQLLVRGRSVLMHDADVFFRPGGLRTMTSSLAHAPSVDFALQHNGRRTDTYDDLNWGFVWMSGSDTCQKLISCTLDVWTHKAFRPPAKYPHSSYHARSQPRINHVLELAIQHATSQASMPRVCTFPAVFLSAAMSHFTGYSSAEHKIRCARANGLLDDAPVGLRGRLLYMVPANATVYDQTRALATALSLGNAHKLGVAVPQAWYDGVRVPFCKLFDVMNLPRMVRGQRKALIQCVRTASQQEGLWKPNSRRNSLSLLQGLLRRLQSRGKPRGTMRREADGVASRLTTTCISFESLMRLSTSPTAIAHADMVKTCKPNSPAVNSSKACQKGLWEIEAGL